VGDATALALTGERFDTVVCLELLEHVPNYEQLLVEVRRMLRPGGRIIISTPNKEIFSPRQSRPVNPWHVREFTRDEFTSMLGRHFDDLQLWGQTFSTYGTLPLTLLHQHVQRYLTTQHSNLSNLLGVGYGWMLKAAVLSARFAIGLTDKDPNVIARADELPPRRMMYFIAVGRKRSMAARR
jgi:SAM-dependent methyltransferase